MAGPLHIEGRTIHQRPCLDCGEEAPHVTGYVSDADEAVAVYFASCHTHAPRTARIDVVLGSWGHDDPLSENDHVTFSCELRPAGAMALDGPLAMEEVVAPMGRALTRDEALPHPWAPRFWAVVDVVAEHDEIVLQTVYDDPLPDGHEQLPRWWRRRRLRP